MAEGRGGHKTEGTCVPKSLPGKLPAEHPHLDCSVSGE